MNSKFNKLRVGFVGARGLVGSVLFTRMQKENDFNYFIPYFFSTSQKNVLAPDVGQLEKNFLDAYQLDLLSEMSIIVTCQGSAYTALIYDNLRRRGWNGYWIDAASNLRLKNDSIIVLDPVNQAVISKGIESGIRTFVGGNCTVSLMLLALKGLFAEELIDWISIMTYQAASGAGAKAMDELLKQIQYTAIQLAENPLPRKALEADIAVNKILQSNMMPTDNLNAPLLGNVLPWIDTRMDNGQSKEEWKAMHEANKILQSPVTIPIDGTCVRIGAFRAHSQALTVKLNKKISLSTIEEMIQSAHPWIRWVPNDNENTIQQLTPLSVSGTLDIAVGRVRKMSLGEKYLNVFTVGDQLLWGAAEPIRRVLRQLATCV